MSALSRSKDGFAGRQRVPSEEGYEDEEPGFKTPWAQWTRHGEILLSGDRGERQLNDIRVFSELPRAVFESPERVDLESL